MRSDQKPPEKKSETQSRSHPISNQREQSEAIWTDLRDAEVEAVEGEVSVRGGVREPVNDMARGVNEMAQGSDPDSAGIEREARCCG